MASKAVNVPTDTKIKEKDINAKLQLYGIYAAFAQGKVPSNKQIDVAMNTALEWRGFTTPSKKLSAEGQALVRDLREVIEKAKIMILTKNDGNLIQDFIWQTQAIGTGDAKKLEAPLEKDQAKQHGQEAVQGLRTLGELIITNGQFRKLLNDAVILLRDIAGDGATKAAGKLNPSDEELAQIDHPAEDHTWHEKPDYSGIKSQIQDRVPFGSKQEAKDAAGAAAGDAAASAHPDGSRDPAAVADLTAKEKQDGVSTGVDPAGGAGAGAQSAKNKISDRMNEDDKEKLRQYRERTRNYFKEKVPKDRRDQVVLRLKKMVVEIQSHSDYQQAIDTLLRLAEEYAGHGKNLANQGHGSVKGARNQDTLTSAEADLRELLERFANGTSSDDLQDSINQIYQDADKDPELKNWFKDLDKYIRRCLQEQGYIIDEASNQEWNRIYDKGNFLLRERYKNHTDRIVDELKFFGNEFDKDPQNKAFANSMDKLFNDLGNDENGKPTFKPHLVKDLTEVLIPAFFENIRYVPIPRIEYSDKMMDAVVENLVIEGDNLAPNTMEFGSDNYWKWGRKGAANKNKNKVMLSVSGIQMDIRDVAYYVKKKEGFPSVTDKGVMDIFLGGTGLSFKMAMETADKSDKHHFFKINTVNVDLKNMNIKLKQSNHKLLFNLFKPLLFKVLKPVIQKVVEKQLRDNVTSADAFLFRVKKEADRATEAAKANPDPDSNENTYKRYFDAFQKQLQKSKDSKPQKSEAEKGQVNVAMTQHDSIFKNISLPGGISTKATEYKNLADKGEKWESPVFSIGSGKESSNLPAISRPQRKPHNVTQGGVRDHTGNVGPAAGTGGNLSQFSSGTTGGLDGTTGGVGGTTGLGSTAGGVASGLEGKSNGLYETYR